MILHDFTNFKELYEWYTTDTTDKHRLKIKILIDLVDGYFSNIFA